MSTAAYVTALLDKALRIREAHERKTRDRALSGRMSIRSVGMRQPADFPKLLTGGGVMLQDMSVQELEAELAQMLQLGFTEEAKIVQRELDSRRAAKTAKEARERDKNKGTLSVDDWPPQLRSQNRRGVVLSLADAGSSGGSAVDAAIRAMTRQMPGQLQRQQQEQLAASMSVGADDEDRLGAAIRAMTRRLPRA
jgi:hypothetical protein